MMNGDDIGEKPSLANILCNIGGLYFLLSNYKESVKYLEKSIYIQKDICESIVQFTLFLNRS